ncbi:MAG: transporter related, partial [Actinomycetia bacterium]|nr:transporter related [Actinomycetes bacterium]
MSDEGATGAVQASALAAAVLEEEDRRLADDEARTAREEMADERMPGVGDAHMPLKEAFRLGGTRTLAIIAMGVFLVDVDQTAINVLAPDIQKTFNIGDTLLSAITALTGLLVLLGSLPVGYYGDRIKRTGIISSVFAVFAVFVALTGFVQTAWQLGIARMGSGVGRSINPVKVSVLADAYPIAARGRIMSLERASSSLGYVLGPLAAGLIAKVLFDGNPEGWRMVWFILCVPTFLVAIAALRLKEPRRGKNEIELILGDQESGVQYKAPPMANAFARLRNIRTFYFFLVGMAVMGFSILGYATIYSLYLKNHYGMEPLQRGVWLAIGSVGGVLGAIVAGRYADRTYRESPARVVVIGSVLLACFSINVIGIRMPNEYLMLPFIIVGTGSIFAAFAMLQPVIAAVQPPRMRSQGATLIGVYLYFIGGFGGALLVGSLSDAFGERTALTVAIPPAVILGAALMAYGARFVKGDIQLMVEELDEERFESERLRAGGTVPVLQVRNLDFAYGALQILFDVNFEVQKGETLALLGTNGAGKSTLLRAISGLGILTRGVVRLNGQTLTYADAESRFHDGILQVRGADVFPGISVEDNLKAALLAQPDKWKRADELMARVFEVFPVLEQRRRQDASSLSGGEQQMVAFGSALMHDPEVLLIDELSLGLSPAVVGVLLDVVRRLNADGVTVVIVEQSLNVAASIAPRAVFLERGTIRYDGPTADLLDRPDLARAVFLPDRPTAPTPVLAPRSGTPLPDRGARTQRGGGNGDAAVALDVTDVRKGFGGVAALQDVSLQAKAGEIVGIIGANGAGKTTL